MMNLSICSSTPNKTQTLLQHLSVLSNTYYEGLDPKEYIYWPNTSLELAIAT
jgi:hypothetical protein